MLFVVNPRHSRYAKDYDDMLLSVFISFMGNGGLLFVACGGWTFSVLLFSESLFSLF